MQPKTEEILYLLLWTAEGLMRPRIRDVAESFEGWAYRKGFYRQLATLERRQLVEHMPGTLTQGVGRTDRLYRLTDAGRLHALGGRDPVASWSRPWDGRWHLVLFDVPCERNVDRERLRRFLRSRSYGCLQGSVWISPDQPMEVRELLKRGMRNVESLILFEARPVAGERDDEIVGAAWNFREISRRYEQHQRILDRCPRESLTTTTAAVRLRRWAAEERMAWLAVMEVDPLLPRPLWPPGYSGEKAWDRRVDVLAEAGHLLSGFRVPS